ncbi:MAG TPA: M24 family metallopeptidase [Kofleriaceae bacterium]|nr:M24 family metallopeptidase [Kofleriaceae bacterium]
MGPRVASAQAVEPARARFDLEAVQGILAVQRLDGWLLYDAGGTNRIALELVNPEGTQTRRWFYLIPARGQPIMLVHRAEAGNFDNVIGQKIEYTGHRDLTAGLRTMLKGIKKASMEYAPKSGIPSLSRVDASTVALVQAQGVKIESSANLVQFTKSLWGPVGRVAHYVAAHHLTKLRLDALAHLRDQIEKGRTITEYDLQQRILRGYKVRGIVGPPPVVAANENAADPNYVPRQTGSAEIRRGDLLLLGMSAQLAGSPRPIFADTTWMAYVGDAVPERYAVIFEVLVEARDTALEHVRARTERHRPVKGFEADQKARQVVAAAGHADKFLHRTGHSLDTALQGDGANLDDFEAHDTRLLVQGSGFTIEPGVYYKGDFGMRTQIDVYLGLRGLEVTTPAQTEITALLAK